MDNSVEEIKSRLNIVDVIGEYVKLQKAGVNWKALCPFHHEKGASFMVNEEKQFYHCFGCNKSGDIFAFIMEIESLGFREALKLLAEKAGVQLTEYNPQQTKEKDKSLEILELATKFYETQLWKGMGKDKILNYLHERGLNDKSIENFRLGYSPNGWDNIIKFLVGRGYTLDEINKTGLLVQKNQESRIMNNDSKFMIRNSDFYDRFRDRIMFPVSDAMGKVVGYSARVAPGGDESQAKYINTPETGVYHKSKVLYGLYQAKSSIKSSNFVLLVEGNLDVIAAHQAGIENTVAVSGTALTLEQLDILKRYTENIKMLFDMDSAGQQAAKRSADLCFQKGLNVHMVVLGGGKDAAEVAQKDPESLVRAVNSSSSAMDFFFDESFKKHNKTNPEDKKKIASEILDRLKNITNNIEKAHWVKKLSQELEVEEKAISSVLKTVTNEKEHINNDVEEKIPSDIFTSRSDVVRNRIAGTIMSDENVWRESVVKYQGNEYLQGDPLLRYILEKGESCSYSFDRFLLDIEDESKREILQKIYFDAKYDFDNMGNIVEYSHKEKTALLIQYIESFIKELQKQQLGRIIKSIKEAEQAGDKEKLNELMRTFTQLSQEIK